MARLVIGKDFCPIGISYQLESKGDAQGLLNDLLFFFNKLTARSSISSVPL